MGKKQAATNSVPPGWNATGNLASANTGICLRQNSTLHWPGSMIFSKI
jgi:hypothetical protein